MFKSRPRREAQEAFQQLTGRQLPQEYVSYVIPDLDRDIEGGMFLTMKLAEQHGDPIVANMYDTARHYFRILANELGKARAGDAFAHRRAIRMASFPEAWEIGFGYTMQGSDGRGIGSGTLSRRIVDELMDRPGYAMLCSDEPDAITFIPGVGLDRASDAIATICKRQLIEFTQEQARIVQFRKRCMKEVRVENVWDPDAGNLVSVTAELPAREDGRPILLVPKGIVRSSPPVRAEHYRSFFGLKGDTKTIKEIIAKENRDSPDRLLRAMRKVFDDPRRYRPRREFRD